MRSCDLLCLTLSFFSGIGQFSVGALCAQGAAWEARGTWMCIVHSRLSCCCYACSWRAYAKLCQRNLEPSYPTRWVIAPNRAHDSSLELQFSQNVSILVCRSLAGFLAYAVTTLLLVGTLVLFFEPRYGQTNILIYLGICSSMGSLTVSVLWVADAQINCRNMQLLSFPDFVGR